MFDKLNFKYPDEVAEAFIAGLNSKNISRHPDSFYKDVWSVDFGNGRRIMVKSGRRIGLGFPTSIETNPSHWPNLEEYIKDLSFLKTTALVIDRVDIAATLETPYKLIYESMRVRFKRRGQVHREYEEFNGEKTTGIYFGSGRDFIVAYDFGHRALNRRFKKTPGSEVGVWTRVERRLNHGKIPYTSLSQLKEYLSYPVFDSVEGYRVSENTPPETYAVARAKIQDLGMHRAFRNCFNKGSNFHKTWAKYITPIPLADQLHENYRSKLSSFLDEGPKVEKNREVYHVQ